MAGLVSLGFLHRDLAVRFAVLAVALLLHVILFFFFFFTSISQARNVLVSSDLRCKVSDFGHARDVQDDEVCAPM